MTAVPKRLLRTLDARDGHRCAWHDEHVCDPATLVPHHRINRGMGGSPLGDALGNLVWLCSHMNWLIEADDAAARHARMRGIKVSRNGRYTAADIPIDHAVHGWCLLGDDGTVTPLKGGAVAELMDLYGFGPWEGVPA